MGDSLNSQAEVTILIAGTKVKDDGFLSFCIERDIFQPDHCTLELSNEGSIHSKHKLGDSLEIQIGDDKKTLFKGELCGMKPHFGKKCTITLIGFNKLHLLCRGKSSKTYQDKTDEAIIKEVLGKHGLTLEWKHDKSITYKHVYQHNLSDLEFVRQRAARLGCHLWCVDTTVTVKQPELNKEQDDLKLGVAGADNERVAVTWFHPHQNSTQVVKKVTVKGWDPEKKTAITGEASAESSPLGGKNASSAAGDLGKAEMIVVDQPVASKDEADALAKGKLVDMSLSYITGELEMPGNPGVELGKHVDIAVKQDDGPDPFNGKYYIMGIKHINRTTKNKGGTSGSGGFCTRLQLARDGQDS